MIYEGKNIQEIAQWRNVPVSVFDEIVRQIMHKTSSNTWEELRIIGAQLAQITAQSNGTFSSVSFTKEEHASIEYLANKWKLIPETDR
jgi:hypothetical protein